MPVARLDGGLTRKSIITNPAIVTCDVCGRTLLRGEQHDVFLAGGARRNVCELCTGRAVHEGWIREGLDDVVARSRDARGRSRGGLLSRLRYRRGDGPPALPETHAPPRARPEAPAPAPERFHDDAAFFDGPVEPAAPEPVPAEADMPAAQAAPAPVPAAAPEPEPEPELPRAPEPPRERPATHSHEQADHTLYESRSVHGVPTNAELKVARALELFNGSPHVRTVYGVGRSLGAPIVSARPSRTEGSVVTIVVAWELSWYRFEVDLANEGAGVRVAAQGAELDELEEIDQTPNAAAGDDGRLHPAASLA